MNVRRFQLIACSVLLLPILAVGCGGGEKKTTRKRSSSKSAATFKVDPATAGSISGSVKFDNGGKPVKLNMSADPYCDQAHPSGAHARNIMVNSDGQLQNVFVYVKKGLEGKSFATPDTAAVLDQKGCQYEPHVSGVMVDQTITIRNSDNTLHNVHAMPKNNSGFNLAQPVAGMESEKSFGKVEVMVPIKCDVHPWMATYVGVLPHPYFSVSDASGAFNIGNLPPGDYEIEAWHEKFGTQTQTVTVGNSESKTLEFSFTGS